VGRGAAALQQSASRREARGARPQQRGARACAGSLGLAPASAAAAVHAVPASQQATEPAGGAPTAVSLPLAGLVVPCAEQKAARALLTSRIFWRSHAWPPLLLCALD
jgi:hypothetical protein